jgi:hypothetical protein
MLKQRVTDLSIFPNLAYLRQLVIRQLGSLPRRLDVFRLLDTEDQCGAGLMAPCYVLETDSHVTPPFVLDKDGMNVLGIKGGLSIFTLNTLDEVEQAAQVLARELAEVA